ncbi:glycosyltransferase family 2 protein [Aeromonas veronii]
MECKPKVSIGIPVYNGEKTLSKCIESILCQSYSDFELIIADNSSTDKTQEICQAYSASDTRVKYVRHVKNHGAEYNFRFVLENSVGEYFMWAAVDDTRSPDFLEEHVDFLDRNPSYVSSTSSTTFDGKTAPEDMMGDWGLAQDKITLRMLKFFSCWHANGHFYGLHRRTCVITWPEIYGDGFHGADWTLVMHLASLGKIHRSNRGWVKLGAFGVSAKRNLFASYRKTKLDYLIPFNQTSLKALKITSDASGIEFLALVWKLFKFNINGFKAQFEHDLWDRRVSNVIHQLNFNNQYCVPFAICGAGVIGQRLYGSLNDKSIEPLLFTDKGMSGRSLAFDGKEVPVVTIALAMESGLKNFIIASKEYASDIESELEYEAGLRNLQLNIIKLFG